MNRLAGLLLGPVLIMLICIAVFGVWGIIIGMFVGFAACVFIPIFVFITGFLNIRSLPGLLLFANLVPLGVYALNCSGGTCAGYSWAAASPQYVAASFCAFIVWLFVRQKPGKTV